MKHILFFILIMVTFTMQSQDTGSVVGKILDTELNHEPLMMANVALKGTSWSTQTNFNGNFEITNITPGNYILQVDFLGYERLEVNVAITKGERLDILNSLKAKTQQLLLPTITANNEDVSTTSIKSVL